MRQSRSWLATQRSSLAQAAQALRLWGPRQIGAAIISSLGVALLIGVATVLIPNPIFGRDVPPVAWNYPVWILTSIMTGMLIATYVRPTSEETQEDQRSARVGGAAGILAWFAVGCPVCNKIALLALGYTGALTWFAPFQPVLAVLALVLGSVALVWRLRGQVSCPVSAAA